MVTENYVIGLFVILHIIVYNFLTFSKKTSKIPRKLDSVVSCCYNVI